MPGAVAGSRSYKDRKEVFRTELMHRGARCGYLPGGAQAVGPCGRPAHRHRMPAPGAHGGDGGQTRAGWRPVVLRGRCAAVSAPPAGNPGSGLDNNVGYWQGCGFRRYVFVGQCHSVQIPSSTARHWRPPARYGHLLKAFRISSPKSGLVSRMRWSAAGASNRSDGL